MNLQKKIYLAFDNGTDKNTAEFDKYPISESAIVKFARNQHLKEDLYVVYRIGDDTATTMFKSGEDKKVVVFKDDHKFAW